MYTPRTYVSTDLPPSFQVKCVSCHESRLRTPFLFLVPDYDITEPHLSSEENKGNRKMRSIRKDAPSKSKFYKMKIFDEELPLKLSLNDKLVSPYMRVEIQRGDGTTDYYPAPQNNFYLGKVISDPESMVAVRDEEGMVRAKSVLRI